MKNIKILIFPLMVMGVFLTLTSSCKKGDDSKDVVNNPTPSGTVTDIDGNVYHTVKIGTQTWMVENLKTTKYRNGDAIQTVTDSKTWGTLTSGAQGNFNNDAAIGNKYGKLYNWYAVNDSRNIAPAGCHVASHDEWIILIQFVESNLGTSGSVSKALAATTDWASSNVAGAVGNDLTKNNIYGFTALPGGDYEWTQSQDSYHTYFGEYGMVGEAGHWWVMTLNFVDSHVYFTNNSNGVNWYNSGYLKESGLSVRCIKD